MPLEVIDATSGLDELQTTELVKFNVEVSDNVPKAEYCLSAPTSKTALAGVTAIETSVGLVQDKLAEAITLPYCAEIIVAPEATATTTPLEVIVATAGLDEFQTTRLVISRLEVSENAPVAVYCWTFPTRKEALAGVTAIDTRVGLVQKSGRILFAAMTALQIASKVDAPAGPVSPLGPISP
jgi:hypothetical protein